MLEIQTSKGRFYHINIVNKSKIAIKKVSLSRTNYYTYF